jgi:hypothetical protein
MHTSMISYWISGNLLPADVMKGLNLHKVLISVDKTIY